MSSSVPSSNMREDVNIKKAEVLPSSNVRENLVSTAVKFLQNSKVQESSNIHKVEFLRKKGLTDPEIGQAFQRSKMISNAYSEKKQDYNIALEEAIQPDHKLLERTEESNWSNWKNVARNIIIVTGFSFGIYHLFDRYISPLLWGNRDRLSLVEESIESLDRVLTSTSREFQDSLQELKESIIKQQQELAFLREGKNGLINATTSISRLETEIISVKGLLLNRRQFPTVPNSTPGIPAWQRNLDAEEENPSECKESVESPGDPSPFSNGTSSPELLDQVDERCNSE